MGVDTTVCLRSNVILRGFDSEISEFLYKSMEEKGIKFLFNEIPKRIFKTKNKFLVEFKNQKREFGQVMSAIGRAPFIDNLNIKNTKVKITKRGDIIVNDYYETHHKNIFAIGDVINRVQLTPVAIAEAMNLVNNLKKGKKKLNYNNIPTAVFSNPNVATVGLSENEARLKFKKIKIFKSTFKPLKLSLGNFKEKGIY